HVPAPSSPMEPATKPMLRLRSSFSCEFAPSKAATKRKNAAGRGGIGGMPIGRDGLLAAAPNCLAPGREINCGHRGTRARLEGLEQAAAEPAVIDRCGCWGRANI